MNLLKGIQEWTQNDHTLTNNIAPDPILNDVSLVRTYAILIYLNLASLETVKI